MNYNLLDNPPPATPEQKRYRKWRNRLDVDRLRTYVEQEHPTAALVHGWRHDGPGRPLYGWHLQFAAGKCRYLGPNATDALEGRT